MISLNLTGDLQHSPRVLYPQSPACRTTPCALQVALQLGEIAVDIIASQQDFQGSPTTDQTW